MRAIQDKVFSFNLLVYVCSLSCCAFFLPQGGSTQSNPSCTSSNGSVLACIWSPKDFQDPDANITISGVSYLAFGTPNSMTFNETCSVNASTSSASCTIRVYHNATKGRSCRKELNIVFSAVSRTKNITETLRFTETEVIMAPPSGINATVIAANEIEVRWGPPYIDKVCPCAYFCVQLQYASRITNTWHTAMNQGIHGETCDTERRHILGQLSPGTLHDIRMRAKVRQEAPFGSWSENVTVRTLEEAPTGLVRHITQDSQRIAGHPYERIVHFTWSWKGLDRSFVSTSSWGFVIELPSLQRNWTTNRTSFTIPDVDPFSEYLGFISAYNSAGQGRKTSFHIPDMTSQPQTPRANFTITPTSITLSIAAPDQPNGVIIRYDIRWRDYKSETWLKVTIPWTASPQVIQQVISPLKPGTSYTVEVKVFNKHGSSMQSERIVTPQEVPSLAPRKFTVDTVPGEPHVVEIGWKRLQECDDFASGYRIVYCPLNGSLFGNNTRCKDAEKTISINKAGVGVPDSSPFRVGGLVPFTWYSFRLRPFNQAGDGPTSDTVFVRTLQGVPSPPVDLNLSPMSPHGFMDVTWSPPLTPNGVIMHYVITYNTNTTRTNSTFIRLKVYGATDYVVGLSACTRPDTGFACSAATFQRFRTPISAPSSPRLQDVLRSGPTKVKVRWEPPNHPNGPIKDYVIKVWSTSTSTSYLFFENARVDQREDEVAIECGENVQQEKAFEIKIEIFARTVNEEGVELEGESDTEGIVMCGAPQHVSAMTLIIPLSIIVLISSLILAGLIYWRWFRRSHKLDIYFSDIANIRKRNKRFQHLRIPKPDAQESEVFDVIRTRPSSERIEVEPNEAEKHFHQLTIIDDHCKYTGENVPRAMGYLSKDDSCSVSTKCMEYSRRDVCFDNGDDDGDENDNRLYTSGSSGYLSLDGLFSSNSLYRKSYISDVESLCKEVVYSQVLVTPRMPKNSHMTRSLPSVAEQTLTTSSFSYQGAKDVFKDSRKDTMTCEDPDKILNIDCLQRTNNLKNAPFKRSHDEPVYYMLARGEGECDT